MMYSALAWSLLLIAVSSNLAMAIKKEKRTPQTLSRGWGDDITWVQTYEEGLFQARKSVKPLMVIHHLEDCQYCQALKKVFAENEEIQEMAQNNFIMLNLMHETTDKNLSPDGQYVPRIMFVVSPDSENRHSYGTYVAGIARYLHTRCTGHFSGMVGEARTCILDDDTRYKNPSLTVRADITGRYSNRLYTYEPQDIPFLIENMKKALRLLQTEL